MSCAMPAGISAGQILRHVRYYQSASGDWKSKYLLILAGTPGGDVIYRLLTSRAHGRPRNPRCFHGDPFPGYYLGYLGSPLTADSWLSLQATDDYDGRALLAGMARTDIRLITSLSRPLFCSALDCVARAEDTTRQQERCIRDVRAELGCP